MTNSSILTNLVSIIIPVYNVENYLHACLNTVIAQDYQKLEIILINDGSKDGSFTICKEYAAKDNRIHLIDKPNGGQSSARNAALDVMTGDWVMFVDSDDQIEPNMVSTMLNYALNNKCEIVRCNCMTRGMNRDEVRKLPISTGLYEHERINELIIKDLLGSQPWFGLYKSKLWKNVRFPTGRIYEDLAVLFRVYVAGKGYIGIIDEPLYIYNLHDDSTSFKISPNKNYDRFLAFKEHSDYAAQAKLPYEDYCFHNTAITAIGTLNYYIRFKQSRLEISKLNEAIDFLNSNRKRVLHDKFNSKYHRLMFAFFYLNHHLYRLVMSLLYSIKK